MRSTVRGLILTGVLLAQAAIAGPWDGLVQVQAQMQQPHPNQFQRPPQRDFRRPEAPPDRQPRDARMSEEERRNLHRDLDRANREIYKGRR